MIEVVEYKEEKILYDKFIEAYEVSDYEVLTPNGWVNIEGIGKTILYNEWILKTHTGKELICADEHILYRCDNLDFLTKKCDLVELFCKNLSVGDVIMTKDGPELIVELEETSKQSNMFDLQISEGSNKQYYINDILSHNSLWLQNIAVNCADNGYNVLYVTLEMSVKKILKRLGAIRLNIPINEYDQVSNNVEYIKEKIGNLKNDSDGIGISFTEKKVGKIITKFWAAGTATVDNIDRLIDNIYKKKGLKIDMVLVDYLTLLSPPKGLGLESNLFQKGKNLAEGLRAVAAKYEVPVISAVQIAKEGWNTVDITMDQLSESKAIAETCDNIIGIIRTPEMKAQNIYRIKMLKMRDGDFQNGQIKFAVDPKTLKLSADVFIDSL